MSSQAILGRCTEILKGRFYWVAASTAPRNSDSIHAFCIDGELRYEPFFADFGPLHLGAVYRYCKLVDQILSDPSNKHKAVIHFCSDEAKMRANSAFLCGAYLVIMQRISARSAWQLFQDLRPPFLAFRDATMGPCTYQCTILDCLSGLEYALKLRWFNIQKFDVKSYEYYERVENGDMNWVIPNKFLAFAGPSATPVDAEGYPAYTPEDYVPIFKKAGISNVIRLNKQVYDAKRFTRAGIKHSDLFFLDGSCPPKDIVDGFFRIAEREQGAIAIHCKAGLGRTGTLIGLYAMKHYGFPARAFIGWIRICRPGSILGPQQEFLLEMERDYLQTGLIGSAKRHYEMREDVGQGERLVDQKRGGPRTMGTVIPRPTLLDDRTSDRSISDRRLRDKVDDFRLQSSSGFATRSSINTNPR